MRKKNYRYGSSPKKIKNVLRAVMVVAIALILVGSALLLMGGTGYPGWISEDLSGPNGISDGEIKENNSSPPANDTAEEPPKENNGIEGKTLPLQSTPTVNGLFYGDGDENNYYLLAKNTSATGVDRGFLYYNLVGNTLYLLVRVNHSVNDNVFGWSKKNDPDRAYTESAGWKEHTAEKLISSDHLNISVSCGGSNSWDWNHGYLYDADGDEDPDEADWLSGPGDGSIGGGTPPHRGWSPPVRCNGI